MDLAKFFDVRSKIGRLRRAVHDNLLRHQRDGAIPTNGRFVFYELEMDGAIPKSYGRKPDGTEFRRKPSQDVSVALMDLRRAGLVPWDWIVDETREIAEWRYASSAYEYAIEAVERARLDCWAGRPAPLVICEARSTKGVLERIAAEYLTPITATNGQCGGFLVTDVVPKLAGNDREVLYIGDCEVDGPGDQIEDNTRRYVEEHAGRSVEWTRIALTQAQVEADSRLLRLVIDKVDNRTRPARIYEAVECEAVGQVTLERILRDALDELLPEPLDSLLVREDEEREALIALLRGQG